MAAQNFQLESFIQTVEDWGLTDVLLPFLLIFTIIFAVLQKTKILGEGKKNMNVIVSLVIALLVVIPHVTNSYPPNADIVDIMNKSIPQVAVIVVAIVMLFIMLGLLGGEAAWHGKITSWIVIAAAVVVLYIFGASAGWWQGWDWFNRVFGSETVAVIIILLVFGIVIGFVTSEKEKTEAGKKETLFRSIGDFFKK